MAKKKTKIIARCPQCGSGIWTDNEDGTFACQECKEIVAPEEMTLFGEEMDGGKKKLLKRNLEESKKGQPYFACEDCATDGRCMIYGHPCGSMCCLDKPDEYQPDEDRG